MTCRQLIELLIDFVNGDLPPEHCQRIEQHLRACPPCVVYLETYRITIQLTRRLPDAPLPPQLVERLRTALMGDCGRKAGDAGGGESPPSTGPANPLA